MFEQEQGKPQEPDPMQVIQQVMEHSYFPDEVTDADIRDYIVKEKNNELVITPDSFRDSSVFDVIDERIELGVQIKIGEITERFNKELKEHGTEPSMKAQDDANEEISQYRIKKHAEILKEMKCLYEVERQRLVNTLQAMAAGNKAAPQFTSDQTENIMRFLYQLKRDIGEAEKELREWERDRQHGK